MLVLLGISKNVNVMFSYIKIFLDVLSPEDIERDIYEEKMEEQKITELLTGEAELLDKGVVG